MGGRHFLHQARSLACTFTSEPVAQNAVLLCAAVASLNGNLPDNGVAIAHTTALLVAAQCQGIREWALPILQSEIAEAMRANGGLR